MFLYKDKWDLNPYHGSDWTKRNGWLSKIFGRFGDISLGVGRPYNVYDRYQYDRNKQLKCGGRLSL